MTGENKLGKKIPTKIHTFYMPQEDVEDLDKVAKVMGLNRSELLRQAAAPYLQKFRNGEVKLPTFDFEVAQRTRDRADKDERNYLADLSKEVLGNKRSAYSVLVNFAVSLGTDQSLVKDIDAVLTKLKNYDCKGAEAFNDKHLTTFILYLEAVLTRRRVDLEMKRYWRQRPEGASFGPFA